MIQLMQNDPAEQKDVVAYAAGVIRDEPVGGTAR